MIKSDDFMNILEENKQENNQNREKMNFEKVDLNPKAFDDFKKVSSPIDFVQKKNEPFKYSEIGFLLSKLRKILARNASRSDASRGFKLPSFLTQEIHPKAFFNKLDEKIKTKTQRIPASNASSARSCNIVAGGHSDAGWKLNPLRMQHSKLAFASIGIFLLAVGFTTYKIIQNKNYKTANRKT